MAFRTMRRTFAAPLVMTLAALPACGSDKAPLERSGPNPPALQGRLPDVTTPPPPPVEVVKTRSWTVHRAGDGRCISEPDYDCPPNAKCNPPGPSDYPCPDGMIGEHQQIVLHPGAVDCYLVQPPPKCPPNIACNPPASPRVDCPED